MVSVEDEAAESGWNDDQLKESAGGAQWLEGNEVAMLEGHAVIAEVWAPVDAGDGGKFFLEPLSLISLEGFDEESGFGVGGVCGGPVGGCW